ncbi:MAG: endolytic transglycosylase MltG [Candidatus Promineifilaceae bacterium]
MKNRGSASQRNSTAARLGRFALFLVVIFTCFIAAIFLYSRWQDARLGGSAISFQPDPGLNPAQRFYLESYLSLEAEALHSTPGDGENRVTFTVESGETAGDIASNLYQLGLIADVELFQNYVQYIGRDDELEAGRYALNSGMSIPEVAEALSQAGIIDISLNFLNGWRIAEMVEYLAAVRPAQIDPGEFTRIAEGTLPHDLNSYDFLESKPEGAALEGYLFPGSYVVPVDADAGQLIDLMLTRFGETVSGQLTDSFAREGLTIHEAVTLAGIIEKETKVDSEKPLMASVYRNRLEIDMPLQADPTVQYVIGYDQSSDSWWKSPLTEADLRMDSPYNTYIYAGFPPGPITNPALASLQAVATPAETDYLFFVADCQSDVPGSHSFSLTFEEHLEKVNKCRD